MNFSQYQNLTGGSSNDTFRFVPSGFISGILNGGLGQNTLDYSKLSVGIVLNLQNRTSTAIGGGFVNVQALVGSSSIDPVAGYDTLIGANSNTTWNITGGNSGNVNGSFYYSSVENLLGGSANDSFVVNGGFQSGMIQGGKGNNTLDYSQGTSGVVVNLQTQSATGISTLGQIQNLIGGSGTVASNYNVLIGADTANTWNILTPNNGNVNGNINFTTFQNLTGGANVDVFRLSPGSYVSGTISGSLKNTGGDWLDYSALTSPVVVNLAAGTATGTAGVTNIQNVHGSDGGNNLAGNSQGNILVGGQGNDTINGGSGKSLLIGGSGADTINGGTSEDILISSYTNYDNNLPALASILAEWQSPLTFDQRVNHLRNGGGLNGKNVLVADVTVHNDVVPDVVTAGAGRDWLWGQPAELRNVKTTPPSDLIDTPINNPPILAGNSTVIFTVGRPGIPVNSVITVTDVDSLTLASATVQLSSNYVAGQDYLGFVPNTQTGNIVGTFNSTTGTLTLTSMFSTATLAQFQAALRAVSYTNTSSTPSTLPRTVTFQVNDGKASSNTVSSMVSINFAPVVSGTNTINYSASQAPTAINPNFTVSDQNNITLSYATVSLSNLFIANEDVLGFVGNASTGDLVASYNSVTGVLTISSAGLPGTLAQYQAALRLVTYSNSSATPTLFPRTVTYQVNDGAVFSNTTSSTVVVS